MPDKDGCPEKRLQPFIPDQRAACQPLMLGNVCVYSGDSLIYRILPVNPSITYRLRVWIAETQICVSTCG